MIVKTTERVRAGLTRMAAAIGIVVLVLAAISGPVYAFGDSAVLVPILTSIEQAITNKLTGTITDNLAKTTTGIVNAQVDQYSKDILYKSMPGAYCAADVAAPVIAASTARASGYNGAIASMSTTGAATLATPSHASSAQPSFQPTRVIQKHNAQVRSLSATGTCKPYQPVPVDAGGTDLKCTPEERRMVAQVLLGALPPEEMPQNMQGTAAGEVYEAARTTVIARKQLAALALNDADSQERQQFIAAYRAVLQKPTLDDLQKLSATGGVERDSVVLQQLTAQLLLELYVENVELKRVQATILAQNTEAEEREHLSALRRRGAQ